MSAHEGTHVAVWRLARRWMWACTYRHCPSFGTESDFHPTRAEALKAALDHCARYPIEDVKP